MREGCHWRRIRVIVRWNVNRLHGGNGTGPCGGDSLLKLAHFGGERRLVSHRRRHATQQRRDLRTGHTEAENIVDEQEYIPPLVSEVLRHRECGETDSQTDTWRLVHLAIDQDGVLQNPRFDHLTVHLSAFARSLSDSSEDGITLVNRGDRSDKLLNDDGFPHSRAAKNAGLPPFGEGGDQVNNL